MNELEKQCLNCGVVFKKKYALSLSSWKKTKFCSKQCHYENGHSRETKDLLRKYRISQSDPRIGKKHSKESIKKMSESHKKTFILKPELKKYYSKLFEGKRRSPKTEFKNGNISWCKGKKNLKISGEKNYNWKGGTTKLQEKIRKLLKYRQWICDVFERDNFTCQRCFKRGNINLNAHHIKPFSKILNENNIRSIEDAERCVELWNINNGETLCVYCHKLTESYLKIIR